MYFINRAAAVLAIKQPCLDWINSLDKGMPKLTLKALNRESHVYLLPEHETEKALEQIIRKLCPLIFETELVGFCRDESLWPEIKYRTFKDWFDIKVHSIVLDPYEDEIEKEEY